MSFSSVVDTLLVIACLVSSWASSRDQHYLLVSTLLNHIQLPSSDLTFFCLQGTETPLPSQLESVCYTPPWETPVVGVENGCRSHKKWHRHGRQTVVNLAYPASTAEASSIVANEWHTHKKNNPREISRLQNKTESSWHRTSASTRDRALHRNDAQTKLRKPTATWWRRTCCIVCCCCVCWAQPVLLVGTSLFIHEAGGSMVACVVGWWRTCLTLSLSAISQFPWWVFTLEWAVRPKFGKFW